MNRVYHIKPISKINGKPDWSIADTAQINQYLWLQKTDISGKAKLLYDTTGIYVHLEAKEKNIRASYTGNYDMVCEDSCLEFFIAPVNGDRRYFNIEINPNGAMYLGFGYSNPDNIRLIVPDAKILFDIKTSRIRNGWVEEYKIPVVFLQTFFPAFQLYTGLELRGNFYKCGDLTDIPHYIAWNEIRDENPDFHKPEYFGTLLFD